MSELHVLSAKTVRERAALYAIMREASYLALGSDVRRTIEDAASARLRVLRAVGGDSQ